MNPKSLQYFAARTLIKYPLDISHIKNQQILQGRYYLGDVTVPVDMIRALGSRGICLKNDAANKVMDLFTQLCLHSSILVFPSSVSRQNLILTPHHLDIILNGLGEKLTQLSIEQMRGVKSTDDVWRCIGNYCSSRLFRLKLPAGFPTVSDIGVNAITGSKFSTSLTELTLCGVYFPDKMVLFHQMLSNIPNLKKLTLSRVYVSSCESRIALPNRPPPCFGSLPRLEHLILSMLSRCGCSYNCGMGSDGLRGIAVEWRFFPKYCPELKTLQIFNMAPHTEDLNWLYCLQWGLNARNTPLPYLRISSKRSDINDFIVREFKADVIKTGDTIRDISLELGKVGDNGGNIESSIIRGCVSRLSQSSDNEISPRTVDKCRDILSNIHQLIPKYNHIQEVFTYCTKELCFMVTHPTFRQELNLVPSVMDILLTHITANNHIFEFNVSYGNLIDILLEYRVSLDVKVFEHVLRMLVDQHRRIFSNKIHYIRVAVLFNFLYKMSQYCTLDYISAIKRVFDNDLKGKLALLLNHRDVELLASHLEARENHLVGTLLTNSGQNPRSTLVSS